MMDDEDVYSPKYGNRIAIGNLTHPHLFFRTQEEVKTTASVGDFSILSNLEVGCRRFGGNTVQTQWKNMENSNKILRFIISFPYFPY
jgi:hypothetical protein